MFKKVHKIQTQQMITSPNQLKQDSFQIIDDNHSFNVTSGNILMHDSNVFGQNHYYVSKDTKNALIYDSTHSDAYQTLIKPTINNNSRASEKYQKSMIINVPSGKIYHDMNEKLSKRGYSVKVLNLRNTDYVYYNPLNLVVKDAYNFKPKDAKRDCDRVARTIFESRRQGSNIYFYDYARNLFNYLVFHMIKQNKLSCKPKDDAMKSITLPNVCKELIAMASNDKSCISKVLHADGQICGSVYSTFLDCLRFAQFKFPLKASLSNEAIDVDKLFYNKQHPVAVFLETSQIHHEVNKIASMYIIQVVSQVIKHVYQKYDDVTLAHPLQIILAPMSNLGLINDLDVDLSIASSAKISFLLQFSNKEQIDFIYGRYMSANIISNCPLVYYVLSSSDETLEDISNAINESKSDVKPQANIKPVMSVQKLKNFHHGEVIILRDKKKPIFINDKYALPMK